MILFSHGFGGAARMMGWFGTPLAAAGLSIIMIGATVITLVGGAVAPALIPLAVGLLATSVAYGRVRVAPIARAPRGPTFGAEHRPV